MKYSRFLGLKLPEQEDFYNVDDFNSNSIIIEENIDQLHYEAMRRVINAGYVPSIQAGLDASKPVPGTAGRLYVATDTQIIYRDTGTAWQKVGVVNWNDIAGKPTSFMPTAHKSTHATGGTDALTPADIGAASAADLAAHLAETMQDGVHGLITTQNITYYVDVVNGNDSNPGTQSQPLKTIGAAVNKISNLVIAHTVTIQLAAGTYNENVNISNLIGAGSFYLKGAADLSNAASYVINGYVAFRGCTCPVYTWGIKVLGISTDRSAIAFEQCLAGRAYYCIVDRLNTNYPAASYGITVGTNSSVLILNCNIYNVTASSIGAALAAFETSRLYSLSNGGTGNNIGLWSSAGTIMRIGTQPSGTTAETAINGGVIR